MRIDINCVFFLNWRYSEPSVARYKNWNGIKLGKGTKDVMG